MRTYVRSGIPPSFSNANCAMASEQTLPILVLDDELANRELLHDVLKNDRRPILLAETSERALELLHSNEPALMIVDLHLPGMPGTEFIKRVRGDARFERTPIALYTASDITPVLRDFMELMRVEHVIPKPAEPEAIAAAVRSALT